MRVPVLFNHDYNNLPLGYLKLDDEQITQQGLDKLLPKMCFDPGYIPKQVSVDGEVQEAELIEISLVPLGQCGQGSYKKGLSHNHETKGRSK